MSKIDYPLERIKAIAFDIDGVLSPSTIPLDATGIPRRMVNVKDGYALQLAVKSGLHIAIISGANDEALITRYNALGINKIVLCAAEKLPVLDKWIEEIGCSREETAYVGDDIPDYEIMARVGLPVSPADAVPEIKASSLYISPINGGYGVARDLIEQILKAKGLWMTSENAFGW